MWTNKKNNAIIKITFGKGEISKVDVVESNYYLLFFTYIIEAIIQIFLLNRFIKKHVEKYWYEFLGITIIIFLSDILAYLTFAYNSATGLISFHGKLVFICVSILCCNLILWISGLIIKNKMKRLNDENDKKIKRVPFSLIILICNFIIIFIAPTLLKLNNDKMSIMSYLEQKYGDGIYKVVKIRKQYSKADGFFTGYDVSGYNYEIKSDYMENTFIIHISNESSYISSDYFLPVYYSEKYNLEYELYYEYDDRTKETHYNFDKLEEYIRNNIKVKTKEIETENVEIEDIFANYIHSWNNMDGVQYNPNYFIISENYGRIPSMDELMDLLIDYYK